MQFPYDTNARKPNRALFQHTSDPNWNSHKNYMENTAAMPIDEDKLKMGPGEIHPRRPGGPLATMS